MRPSSHASAPALPTASRLTSPSSGSRGWRGGFTKTAGDDTGSDLATTQSAHTSQQWFARIEAVFNELGDDDLSTRLSTSFASWSNLANKPQDMGLRQVVLQEGQSVATWFNDMRRQLGGLQQDADARTKALVTDADTI